MTVAEICVGAYLIVAGLAAGLIWTALVASKPRSEKVKRANFGYSKYSPFQEQNTKPSRSHP